jgi:hypothetical protein
MSGVPEPLQCAAPPARIWKLTPDQYARSVEQMLPGLVISTADLKKTSATVGTFKNDAGSVDLAEPQMEALLSNATELATLLVARASEVDSCLAAQPAAAACVRQVTASFGERAFRRPLTPAEIETYIRFYETETQSGGDGLHQLFRAFFMSPHFLYRTELGEEAAAPEQVIDLTPFERASALAYFIADGPPDAALMEAARRGELATTAQLEAQARRLLATPEGARGMVAFFAEQLQTDRVLTAQKDPKYTDWTPQLAAELAAETRQFVQSVLFQGAGTLAALYAAAPPDSRGLLGQRSLLAAFAHPDDTDIVRRGRFIRERLLCQSMPAPPADLANIVIPPEPDGLHTQRERIAIHSADPGCAGCHDYMDPLGFGLELFDTLGNYRELDVNGKPVDTSGVIVNVASGDRPFGSFSELAQIMAALPEAATCMAGQLYTYANGRVAGTADACALTEMNNAFAASGSDLRELAVKLVSSDVFVKRMKLKGE